MELVNRLDFASTFFIIGFLTIINWKQITIHADADSVKINDKFYSSLPVRLEAPIGTQYLVEKQDNTSEVTFVPCEFNIAEETDNNVVCRWMSNRVSRN